MHGRRQATLAELCPVVWEKDCADVTGPALHSAINKANAFLSRREQQTLEKPRGEPIVRWV